MKNTLLFLKKFPKFQGITLLGTCKLDNSKDSLSSPLPENVPLLPYAISIGYRLSETVLSTIKKTPTLIYKHHYKTVNWILDQTAESIANMIQSKGFNATAIPASQVIDWEQQTAHLSHRIIGQKCGLGWIGRSGLLVNPTYGAKVRYASILTDMPLEDNQKIENGCGECKKCIEACPAEAISENHYDKTKCLAKLREFSGIKGIGVNICGVCVAVCK